MPNKAGTNRILISTFVFSKIKNFFDATMAIKNI